MQLRPYTKADLPTLFALDQVCFPPYISYSRNELKYFLVHPKHFTLVAEEDGRIAGFAITELALRGGRRIGHVITIDVAPSMRRSGTGTLLMAEIERKLRRERGEWLCLEVAIDNEGARLFYHRMGFQAVGRVPGYYAGRVDAITMEKRLTPESPDAQPNGISAG